MIKRFISIGLITLQLQAFAAQAAEADLPNLNTPPTKEDAIPQDAPPSGNAALMAGQRVDVDSNSISTMHPLDRTPGLKTKNDQLEQDSFELGIDRETVNRALKEQRRYERLLGGIQDVSLLQKPISRPLSAIDTIHITTEYMTTIVFPKNYTIQYARGTSTFPINEFDKNVLFIQPPRDFQSGSMAIGMSDGNNNVVVNLIIEKYLRGDILHDMVEGRYLSCGEYISTMIRYIKPDKIDHLTILKRYFKLYGDKAINNFKTSGSFDVITIGGFPYYIIRDDKYGMVDYKNVSFRVAYKYEQFAEKLRYGAGK